MMHSTKSVSAFCNLFMQYAFSLQNIKHQKRFGTRCVFLAKAAQLAGKCVFNNNNQWFMQFCFF